MEKFSWSDCVRNEVLQKVKEKMNILHTANRRKANCVGHILHRNCLLKCIIEGKIGGGRKCWEDKKEDISIYWMTLRK